MNSVCIYCGSNRGRREVYAHAARRTGEALARRGLHLVYGGGRTGMMGLLADAVLSGGGSVTGVVPDQLFRPDSVHGGLSALHVVKTMHERKALMMQLSDALVALPGGLGTLEEICEVLAWGQLGLHAKPCGLLNVAGYFDRYCAFLDHALAEGFIQRRHRDMLFMEENIETLLDRFSRYAAPATANGVLADKL